MHNYYTDQVIIIDIILFALSVFLSLLIILYIFLRNRAEKKYRHRLWEIKKNVYALAVSGAKLSGKTYPPFASNVMPRDLLDVEMNRARDSVFFNAAEQEIFRECFAMPDKIKRVESAALRGRDKWQRIEAILCLGYLGDKSALNIFKKTVFDKDEDVSYFTLMALGQVKTVDSARVLVDFFKKKRTARYKVVSVLEKFPSEITEEVMPLAKEKDPDVRFWALKLLARLGCRRRIKDIEKLTRDPVDKVRAAACECLGESGEKESASYIESCLADDSWLVRASAVKALSDLLKGASIERVMPLINDASLSVIKSVKNAMVANMESALPYLKNILQGQDELAKKVSIETLGISGYMGRLLRDLLGSDDARKKESRAVLEGIVHSHIHDGLVGAISTFQSSERQKILDEIRGIDETLAAEIKSKI